MSDLKMVLAVGVFGSLMLSSCEKGAEQVEGEVNPGQALVMESIAAHGGLEKWYGNGQFQFQWTYYQTDKGPEVVLDSIQTVDTKSLAVAHTVPGSDTVFGWNAGETWINEGGAFKAPPQFWSLLPYYFVGIPFVFNDENAAFELLPEKKEFEGARYDQVKITYSQEAGESPDDYYVLLIDTESKLVRGAYYTVTHPLVVGPEGPGPEKFISLDNLQEFSGIKIGTGNRTFTMTDGEIGAQMRYSEVRGIKFLPEGTVDLAIPAGAKILK